MWNRCVCLTIRALVVTALLVSAGSLAASDGGMVSLVGIGPGSAEMVTIGAGRVLRKADVVYCFGYLKAEVARLVRPEALRVASPLLMGRYVRRDLSQLTATERQKAIESKAERTRWVAAVRRAVAGGKHVAIATAGDPTLFCPWSWVLEELNDLDVRVVPGLSSFNAANAALGQSITAGSGAVLLSSGQQLGRPNAEGRLDMTLVLFTHRRKLDQLLPQLQERYPSDTPVAIVCEASYQSQRVIRGTLGTIRRQLAGQTLPHLYLIYVGDPLRLSRPSGTATQAGQDQP